LNNGVPLQKLKTLVKIRFKSRVILFKETLNLGTQLPCVMVNNITLESCAKPSRLGVHILGLVVQLCVLNQSRGYWLLF
jgi:hypothetical protein